MDFWGFDRSNSLRLNALRGILKHPQPTDINKIYLKTPKNLKLPLQKCEIELILAISFGALKTPENFMQFKRELLEMQMQTLNFNLLTSNSSKTYKPFARQISLNLTQFLLNSGEHQFVGDFIAEFKKNKIDSVKMDAFLGFLDGLLKSANFNLSFDLIKEISELGEPEFLVEVSNLQTENYAVQLLTLTSAVMAKYADLNVNLSDISLKSLQRLETSHSLDPDVEIEASIYNHLVVLETCLKNSKIDHNLVQDIVVRGISDLKYSYEPLVCKLAELAAKFVTNGLDFTRMGVLLPDFFGSVEPEVAFKSAREFAKVYKLKFPSESSQINLVFLFTNKLKLAEFDAKQQSTSFKDAVLFVSSILSVLMALVSTFTLNTELANVVYSTLSQKLKTINLEVDCQIIETWGLLAKHLSFERFGDLLDKLTLESGLVEQQQAVKNARVSIAHSCDHHSQFYIEHLLNLLVIQGDPTLSASLFAPLAVVVSKHPLASEWRVMELSRNAWFSLAGMGFTLSKLNSEDLKNLRTLAQWAPPLVNMSSVNHLNSDIQLNPVLVRGAPEQVLKTQQHALSKVVKNVHSMSNIKMMFMASVLLLEGLRSKAGVISQLPHYFADVDFESGEGHHTMHALAMHLGNEYLHSLSSDYDHTLANVLREVKQLIVLSCHRVPSVRNLAAELVTLLVKAIPASLCKQSTISALFDCVNLLNLAVLNAKENQYSPEPTFHSKESGITIEASDYLDLRLETQQEFTLNAKNWLSIVHHKLNAELKPRLCAYIGNGSNSSGKGRAFALSLLTNDDLSDNFMSQYFLINRYDENPIMQVTSVSTDEVLKKLKEASNCDELHSAYVLASPHLRLSELCTAIVIAEESVKAAFRLFDTKSIRAGIVFWNHIARHRVDVRAVLTNTVVEQSILTAQNEMGVFSRKMDAELPMWSVMEYSPTNKHELDGEEQRMDSLFAPHSLLLNEYLKGSFHSLVLVNPLYVSIFTKLVYTWLEQLSKTGSLHVIARVLRLQILNFGNDVIRSLPKLEREMVSVKYLIKRLEIMLVKAGLSWYEQPVCQWSFGSNASVLKSSLMWTLKTMQFVSQMSSPESKLLTEFLGQEHNKLAVWQSPLATPSKVSVKGFSFDDLQVAFSANPVLLIRIATNFAFNGNGVEETRIIHEFVQRNLLNFINHEEALPFYLANTAPQDISSLVLYWTQLSPISSINLLSPAFNKNNMLVTQMAMRSLQSHDVTKCFFYVPQIVQQLRHDHSGWVMEYILEAAKFSQKFAHQIIWNLLANMYNDDEGTVPNDMKPKLEEVLSKMKENFNADEKQYYETEFNFFAEVTKISGKLKPFIKKSKAEKKAKIDEEMALIKVPEGVYLPSHPDGTVVDIDRLSGKPLQSHAKAPFMATFKLNVNNAVLNQSAIFKVGDDCRQDVLALQVISVFRSIFNYAGLDVFVFPYKVTATNAGRGIIDVLPNSVSRDMLGREAVNGLDQYFHSKYGSVESIEFQRARLNFVKSLAAYSVISYLIQFKDRHNGNIMYDADGHIIHIDFGFCFDIVPGGVRFEAAPFKLTKEMVQVMGGSPKALPYQWFEEQCVRAFLASRVFADDICRVVEPMLESGLPCFKGNTIKRLRERFALHKSEQDAAQFMRHLIAKSHESNYTKGYDEFQRLTNGIPH